MKKILLTIAVITISQISYGQNTFPIPSGNVGIGTSSPGDILDVQKNQNGITNFYFRNTDATNTNSRSYLNLISGNNALSLRSLNADNNYLSFASGYFGIQYQSNNPSLVVNSAGNVGIGTTSPNGKLDVNGAILFQGSTTNTMTRPVVGTTRIAGELSSYSNGGIVYDDGLLRLSAGGGTNADTKSFIDLSGYSTIPDMNRNIVLGTSGIERIRVSSSGNVGIGTTTPDAKLAVKGTIHTQEVKVDMQVPGPDYVFNDDYKLATLTEIKNYVTKNHHLPEIQSAAQMKKDGINLGDMNTKLLKKVEELTLYLIEKDKQVNLLQDEVKQLKLQEARIASLEKALSKPIHKK